MPRNPLLAALLICLFCIPARTQNTAHWCGSDVYWEEAVKENPYLAQYHRDVESYVAQGGALNKTEEDTTLYIIPVVVHVLHMYGSENIPKAAIEAQLQTLTNNFRKKSADSIFVNPLFMARHKDMRIEFRLAQKDPQGNCTDGIVRKYSSLTHNANDNVKALSRWDTKRYLNIWVVATVRTFTEGSTTLGYAQFPWDDRPSTDGIVIRADQMVSGNTTLTHELGHYLGLFHTFQSFGGSTCTNNCAGTGDMICDTPPTEGPTFNCPKGQNTCNSDNPDMPDMIENYMDYTSCVRMFTLGQHNRVMDMLDLRSTLVSAANLKSTGVDGTGSVAFCKPVADFYVIKRQVCVGNSIQFFDNSYNGTVTDYKWSFQGAGTVVSNDKDPIVKFTAAGLVKVTLKVSNPGGEDSITQQEVIEVMPSISLLKVPFIEEFEGFAQKNWEFPTDLDGLGWETTRAAAFTGGESLFLDNFSAEERIKYTFTMPAIDMTTAVADRLTFRMAYARIDEQSNDILEISVSNDCGQNFTRIYLKGSRQLISTPDFVIMPFVPTASQWRLETVSLTSYKNSTNLIVRFSIDSRSGNNFYLDEINIGGFPLSVESPDEVSQLSVSVFPVPATGEFTISVNAPESAQAAFQLCDVSGKVIFSDTKMIVPGEQLFRFTLRDLNVSTAGVYYLRIFTAGGVVTEKIVITP
ncbi:MAG: M43 family zinc metalloprotease [Bacteroidota bacterium]|nr:M43 family zinc metalloprotease [Bacteroidota bacterium]